MISGNEGNYDLILRTGALGKDIIVPTAIAGALTAGVAAIPAAAVSSYRAHTFEKNFWDFIKKTLSDMGSRKATMSQPVIVTH
jgi:broad specificity polyphosphatase/5'/3'-nucleotidase SurE